jgi:hypothetical protein
MFDYTYVALFRSDIYGFCDSGTAQGNRLVGDRSEQAFIIQAGDYFDP